MENKTNELYETEFAATEASFADESVSEYVDLNGVAALPPQKRKGGMSQKRRNRMIFYSIFISLPILHFIFFYVYINFNSIIMAFQKYNYTEPINDTILGIYIPGGYKAEYAGFENFVFAWKHFTENTFRIKNSLIFFSVDILISTPLALLFSYYMYKQYYFSGFFKVILFLPQLLSGLIIGLIFKYIVADVYLYFADLGWWTDNTQGLGLLQTADWTTRYFTVIIFSILMAFGVNVLTYTSTMGGISDSLIESAQLDGANSLQEFFYIVLPMSYPTVSTLMVVHIAHFFTNQAHLFTLYIGGAARLETVGYFLYTQAQNKDNTLWFVSERNYTYPQLSAYGLILTAIILPTTLVIRHFMNKYGPSAD